MRADCLTGICAETRPAPMLYKGVDFAKTDMTVLDPA
jgi:uncharacterized protein with PIN domain